MRGDTNFSARAAFAKAVAVRCALDEGFAGKFRARDGRGNRVVVPMLSSDTVDLACRFVAQSGGDGTLVILHDMDVDRDAGMNSTVVSFRVQRVEPGGAGPGVPFDSNLRLADLMKILSPGVSIELARREFGGGLRLDEIERTEIVDSDGVLAHVG